MGQQALVYRTEPDGKTTAYIGKTEFGSRLAVNQTNSYLHNRRWHVVRIDRIEPATWSPHSEIVPTVFVSPTSAKPVRQGSRAASRVVPRRGQPGGEIPPLRVRRGMKPG
jgi:hypothetical protein